MAAFSTYLLTTPPPKARSTEKKSETNAYTIVSKNDGNMPGMEDNLLAQIKQITRCSKLVYGTHGKFLDRLPIQDINVKNELKVAIHNLTTWITEDININEAKFMCANNSCLDMRQKKDSIDAIKRAPQPSAFHLSLKKNGHYLSPETRLAILKSIPYQIEALLGQLNCINDRQLQTPPMSKLNVVSPMMTPNIVLTKAPEVITPKGGYS